MSRLSALPTLLTFLSLSAGVAGARVPEPWRISGFPGVAGGPVSVTAIVPSEDGGELPVGSDRGWPQATREIVATPIFADLTEDGVPEVIAGDDRYLYAFSQGGALLWSLEIDNVQMHASVADIDGDTHPEIAIASTLPTARLWVINALGSPEAGWPVTIPVTQATNLTCPVIIDLNRDGRLDVGVAAERGVFFYNSNGSPLTGWPYLWPVPVNNPQWSAPAVGDIDHDGSLEVAVGNVCYPNWGVHVIRADGTSMPGWPKVIRPVYSSPALADLDGDLDLEVIAQEGDPGSQGSRMWVWHHDGTVMAGWPKAIAAEGWSSRCNPAVADVQQDGVVEIVTVTADSKLHVLLPNGIEMAGYPKTIAGVQQISSPSVLDVNNDGLQEIFETYWLSSAQYVSGWDLSGAILPGFPKTLFAPSDYNSHSSTHIMDADQDGTFEMAVAGSDMNGNGRVYVFNVEMSVATPASRMDWPKIRQNVEDHGRYIGRNPAETAIDLPVRGELFRIAPNPVSMGSQITMRAPAGRPGTVLLFDPTGRVASRRALTGLESVNLEDLIGKSAAGVFFARWIPLSGGPPQTAKVIVLGR
jgi:hypothetical protein